MAAVIERTGYIAIAGRERTPRVESLRGALNKSAQGMRFVLAAVAAEISLASSNVSLLESALLVSIILVGTVFCFSMDKTSNPVHVRIYRIGVGVTLGVIAGIILSGLKSIDGFGFVGALPLAMMTVGGIITALHLGRYATSD